MKSTSSASASQKIVAITVPADITDLGFLGARDPECFHCFDCSLISGWKWWTQVSSMVMNHWRNQPKDGKIVPWHVLLNLHLIKFKALQVSASWHFAYLQFSVDNCIDAFQWDTQLCTNVIFCYCLICKIMSGIFPMISFMVMLTDLPRRGSSFRLYLPHFNSAAYFFTIL